MKKRKSRGGPELVRHRVDLNLEVLRDTPPWDWPHGAAERLHEVLINRNAGESDRLIAAELAGETVVMNDQLADVLVRIAGSAEEPEKLRAWAAISLGAVLEEADTADFDDPDDVSITESTFHRIQVTLQKLFEDEKVPTEVRRMAMEASVRSPQAWHRDAITAAYSIGDRDWTLTAVFAMRWVKGFDQQTLEALNSSDPDILRNAVQAAGNWELDAAWDQIAALAEHAATPKDLRLAAIEAIATIRPEDAKDILLELGNSDDEDIAEAADEALMIADVSSGEGFGGEDDEV